MVSEIKSWLYEAAAEIRSTLEQELTIQEKSGRTDLVTNMDEQTQEFLMKKIQTHYPEDQILGEEKGFTKVSSFQGRVWIIDPIDGTLNFVLEKENFCIMLAVYEEGVGQLGFIYDVIRDEMYWGGKGWGVYVNECPLPQPAMKELSAGLLGMNAYMYGKNIHHARDIGHQTMGIRVCGCAGLEIIAMLKGNHIGYISKLSPWDYAPGLVLLEEFGFKFGNIHGEALTFDGQEYFLAATPNAYTEILEKYLQIN
jgi:myo-inositol-1(or 4)-monophosphatase